MAELKPWRCPDGHVLGKVLKDGGGINKLLLFRRAMISPVHPPTGDGWMDDEIDVIALVEGYVANVRCSICGRTRTWIPGEEALRKMVENYRRGEDHNDARGRST